MTPEELLGKLSEIQTLKCETQTYEYKTAAQNCPKRLYDTLSSFSNQDEGGTIFFGIDEEHDYFENGVYDPHDLQKKIGEQCLQMEPKVRPVLTVAEKDGKYFVSAEIPPVDLSQRPCFYAGSGRLKGSYVRVGDRDEPMTEYEVYSYEAFRKREKNDSRPVTEATQKSLNQTMLKDFIDRLKQNKPNFAALDDATVSELMSVTKGGQITLSTLLLFCPYPQAYFPQLCVTAVVIPGTQIGETLNGARFLDNQRIEGNIEAMLNGSMNFISKNMRVLTVVNPQTGKREDLSEYPPLAVREALLNAFVHRDYSSLTEGMPIQILMFSDRLEIRSPGGLYGRIRIEQLGTSQPDTRNPVLASALEALGLTENRYSGIPIMRRELEKNHMPPPEFESRHGTFTAIFKKADNKEKVQKNKTERTLAVQDLIEYCKIPRTRAEIAQFLGLSSASYAIRQHVIPLINAGQLRMTLPDKPKSPFQKYYS